MAKEKTPTGKKTPLQIVKERFGEKKKLVAELVDKLERREGEAKDAFEKRLLKVPASKLLNLLAQVEEAAKAGGRVGLTNVIHDFALKAKSKKADPKEDVNFKKSLAKKSVGTLLDTYKTIQKKVRQATKKA